MPSSPLQYACTLQGISKTYGEGPQQVCALQDIHLDIPQYAFICLKGASGSGKSTLLQLIGLLDIPSSGSIRIQGTTIPPKDSPLRDHLRAQHIGFVFQQFHLMERLSVYENVALALRISNGTKVAKEKEIIHNALHAVQLQGKEHRYPKELSGGEQQRVAIARAISKKPTLLIADEPTANLDSKTSRTIISLLQKLHTDQKMTILCASHDPQLIHGATQQINLCDGTIEGS
jgi:putative ABC transport system ATP-binding protein